MDMKRHMLILIFFIFMLVDKAKEWNNYKMRYLLGNVSDSY
jgi:hypothetical protein